MSQSLAWFVFVIAALLEVSGYAAMRRGLHGRSAVFIALGFLILGGYALVVNLVKWDFSRLLGVYVAAFAPVSILFGRFVFKESVPQATWVGLAFIVTGGVIIQFGIRR